MKISFISNNCNISFIETELIYLLNDERITKVHVFTEQNINNEKIINHPKSAISIFGLHDSMKSIKQNLLSLKSFANLFLGELIRHFQAYLGVKNWLQLLRTVRNEIRKSEVIKSLSDSDTAVFYSYWASNEALNAALVRTDSKAARAVTRLHAYDLYEEFNNRGFIPFRWYLKKKLDMFYPVSHDGKAYLLDKHPSISEKVRVAYLGIGQEEITNLKTAVGNVRIVSCGRVTPHKKHLENYYVLNEIGGLDWVHIGDGDDFPQLKKIAKSGSRINAILHGNLSQTEINNLYLSEAFTCFLSLSITEGIPVSMMEAQSFGIPIVSTDVGGCREIVTPETGILLPENYTVDDVKNAIEACATGRFSSLESRKKIAEFNRERFNAEKNYSLWIDELSSITE